MQWQKMMKRDRDLKKGNAGRGYYDDEQGTCHLIVLLFVIDGDGGGGIITQRTNAHMRACFTYRLNGGDGTK